MEQIIVVLKEFIAFSYEIDKSKSVKLLHSEIVTPRKLSKTVTERLLESSRKCFTVVDYDNIKNTDIFEYKAGSLSLGRIQRLCSNNNEDLEAFEQYMECFKKAYHEDNEAVDNLLKELDIEIDSPEATFMRKVFNEIGQEFMDMIRGCQESENLDIASLLPRVATLFKTGKFTKVFEGFSESNIKMSKILLAVGKLLQKYEDKDVETVKDGEPSE